MPLFRLFGMELSRTSYLLSSMKLLMKPSSCIKIGVWIFEVKS